MSPENPHNHRTNRGAIGWQSPADQKKTDDLNAASTVATNNAIALKTLAGADMANNIAFGAITGGDVTGLPDPTLGGDTPAQSGGTSSTTYLIFAALAFGGWLLWKKHHKKK